MDKRTDAVVGMGEVGNALTYVLEMGGHEVTTYDIKDGPAPASPPASLPLVDVLNICFPYRDCGGIFEHNVRYWQERFCSLETVIHSTVPVGTSRFLHAVHSPVVGLHPNLARSLLTFTKFLGGERAEYVADHFRSTGMKVYLFKDQETTELMKILSTTYHALNIEWTKEVAAMCRGHSVPYEAWTLWTDNYNRGYSELGYPEYTRPQLIPITTKIGGHCLLPNARFIEEDNEFARIVLKRNSYE